MAQSVRRDSQEVVSYDPRLLAKASTEFFQRFHDFVMIRYPTPNMNIVYFIGRYRARRMVTVCLGIQRNWRIHKPRIKIECVGDTKIVRVCYWAEIANKCGRYQLSRS
jgi:hypothetical protein